MSPEELNVEARARIVWGEEPSSVHAFLTSNGMSAADADQKIQELVDERNEEVRRIGIRETCIGGAILLLIAIFIWHIFRLPPSRIFPDRRGKSIMFGFLVGLFGIWKLFNGLFHLLRPRTETRSIPDMAE
jgi:hypothetical protein